MERTERISNDEVVIGIKNKNKGDENNKGGKQFMDEPAN